MTRNEIKLAIEIVDLIEQLPTVETVSWEDIWHDEGIVYCESVDVAVFLAELFSVIQGEEIFAVKENGCYSIDVYGKLLD